MNARGLQRWDEMVEGFTGSRAQARALVAYCQIFTSEDAMTWALQAVMQAVRGLQRPEGSWVEAGWPWSEPRYFADEVVRQFERRVLDACERSQRVREVDRWKERRVETGPDLLRPHMPTLPQCVTVAAEGAAVGGGGC